MAGRNIDLGRITSEQEILEDRLNEGIELQTDVKEVEYLPLLNNTGSQDILGLFRSQNSRKFVSADMGLIAKFKAKGLKVPSFLEAGPRAMLRFDPTKVRAAIVTTGGLAPGLHHVIHSIVKRHCDTYSMSQHGNIFGVYNSFRGLCNLANNLVELNTKVTEEWLDQGGSKLGIVRYFHEDKKGDEGIVKMADVITSNLTNNRIDILYVLGGDGSLRTAHEIALNSPKKSVIGIPKTMDNDILWVWHSFGFDTAVEQATRVINTLRSEAEATRRICLIELFGAESGFVAANSALASGHVDAVLIPEVFKLLNSNESNSYIKKVIDHIQNITGRERHNPHAIVVVAEGVGTVLEKKEALIGSTKVNKEDFLKQLSELFSKSVVDASGQPISVFVNQPRHHIRAVPANAQDRIYCEKLGALAVDTALAGYTDCMISQWLTEHVLVPLDLVRLGQKSIPVHGVFWKKVVSSTGQPLSEAERVT